MVVAGAVGANPEKRESAVTDIKDTKVGASSAGGRSTRKSLPGRVVAALGALLLVLASGLISSPAQAQEEAPKLRVAIISEIDTFNPFRTILASSINVNRLQYENLVEYGPAGDELVGGLADKWETSPDGMTWTFHMPDDRVWSDGEPITSADVKWTFDIIKEKEELQSANGSLVENVASVEAPDKNTAIIKMSKGQASNPGNELPIMPKHVWENVDQAEYAADGSDGKPVVGSGPYQITKYEKGQSVEMQANPKFHRGAPKVSGLTWVYYKNTDAAVAGLKAGEVDLVSGMTGAQFDSLKDFNGITTNAGAGRRYTGIAVNPGAQTNKGEPMGDGHPALHDPQVRKAVLMAIDNKTLLEKVLGGLGKPGITQTPTIYEDIAGLAPGNEERKFDLEGANKILDEAGYPKGPDGIRAKDGKPLKFRVMGRNTEPTHAQAAEYVKQWMKDIGVDTEVSMVSSSQVNSDSTVGKYDLYFTGWGMGPDPDFQLSINQCASRPDNVEGDGPTSENNYCNPAFDELYAKQHAELDPAKRAAIVKEAWTTIYNDNVLDVLWYQDGLEAYRSDKFGKFELQPTEGGVITGQTSYWGLYSATPAGKDGAAAEGGSNALVKWGVPIGIVVVVAAVGIPLLRRRGKSDDKE